MLEKLYGMKIDARRYRLKRFFGSGSFNIDSRDVEEVLRESNERVIEYLGSKNSLWHFLDDWHLSPNCGPHSLYTYANFLNLTEENRFLRDKVFWSTGITVLKDKEKLEGGHHAFIGIETDTSWKPYETVQCNRGIDDFCYSIWFSIRKDSKDLWQKVYATKFGRMQMTTNFLFNPF